MERIYKDSDEIKVLTNYTTSQLNANIGSNFLLLRVKSEKYENDDSYLDNF